MPGTETISKKPSENPSLNFKRLRKEGIELIQALSGDSWTDYNLHDPGVTTLEVLCYALTELGYRADRLKEAFEAEGEPAPEFVDRYFFRHDEIVPSLPVTRWDFEDFIEKKHKKVLSAWFENYPLLHPSGTARGGYEVALMLEHDEEYGNLNTDTIQISLEDGDVLLEVNMFDEENRRMPWETIREVKSCIWNEDNPDNFFVFEKFNCQVSLSMEAFFLRRTQSETIQAKARITLSHKKDSRRTKTVESYKKAIIKKLESNEFLDAIDRTLSKEHYKGRLLNEIQQTLYPCRNLCEDFISMRVVNEQEVKIDAEITLDEYAPAANEMAQKVYDCLDAFLMQLMRRAKQPEHRSKKNLLYASNLVEEMVRIDGVEAARIRNLNLFVDGVPTIPLNEEAAFECIHMQRFSWYVPKLSREKSTLRFVRSGAVEEVEAVPVSREFKPQLFLSGTETSAGNGDSKTRREKRKPQPLDQRFFDALRHYYSIRNDFPRNYRLSEGRLSENVPEKLRIRVTQFKQYLAFFERILIGYLDRLHNFNDLLSVKQESESGTDELERLKKELPDLDLSGSSLNSSRNLRQKNKILDHLLARFSVRFTPVVSEESDPDKLQRTIKKKTLLLRDIPVVTRERGLGLPVRDEQEEIWNTDLLSGFQKRVYRKLGINNKNLHHFRLTKAKGSEPVGFYLVEHILLASRDEDHIFVKRFNRDAEVLFEYVRSLVKVRQLTEPYSFQVTIVLPNWYRSWRSRQNRVETIISEELPAHILPHYLWLDREEMGEFEILYEDWLESLLRLQTMRPL